MMKRRIVQSILLTLNDGTSLVKAEQQIKNNQMLITILGNIDSFRNFLNDCQQELQLAAQAARDERQDIVRTILHTIKGNAAAFHFIISNI